MSDRFFRPLRSASFLKRFSDDVLELRLEDRLLLPISVGQDPKSLAVPEYWKRLGANYYAGHELEDGSVAMTLH